MKTILSLLLLCLISVSCVTTTAPSAKKMPEWMLFPEKFYAPDQYLFSRGSGINSRTAKKKASENLTLIYNIQMQEARRIVGATYEAFGLPAGFRPTYTPGAAAKTDTPPALSIRTGELFTDSAKNTHTIAYADRAGAAKPFITEIKTAAAKIQSLAARADRERDPFTRYALARAATLTALQNELPITRAALLHPASLQGFDPGYTLTNLFARAAAASAAATVKVNIAGDTSGFIAGAVNNALLDAGLTPAATGVLNLRGNFTTKFTQTSDGRNVDISYTLSLSLTGGDGRVIAEFRETKSDRHPLAEAEARTAQFVSTSIRQNFGGKITAALNRAAGVAD